MEEHEKKTIIKNLKWLTVSKIIVYLLSIVTITLIPRYLGVEGYGQLNFALSFVSLFFVFGDMGISYYVYVNLPKHPEKADDYLNKTIFLKLLLLAFMSIVIIATTLMLGKDSIVQKYIFLVIIYQIILQFSYFGILFFNQLQKMEYGAIGEILLKLFYVIFVILLIKLNLGIFGILWANIISSIVILIFTIWIIIVHFKIKPIFELKFFKEILIVALPYALISVFSIVYFSIDKTLLSLIIGDYFVGLYSISYVFFGVLTIATGVISVAFFPILSKYHENIVKLTQISNKYLRINLIVSIPLAFGAMYLAPQIIALVFGTAFLLGTVAFQIFMLFFLLNTINFIHTSLMLIKNRQKIYLLLLIIACVLNIILNIIFIPILGIVGCAIFSVISELLIFIGGATIIKKEGIKLNYLKESIMPIISGIIMILGVWTYNHLLPNGILNNKFDVLFSVIVGGIIYTLIIFLTKTISIKEIKELIKNE